MSFRPDIQDLIRKRIIRKPEEEFQLPPPPPEPPVDLAPQPSSTRLESEDEGTLLDEILGEMASIQELLDAIEANAEPITLPIPGDGEQAILGKATLSSQDYLDTWKRGEDIRSNRIRERFESVVLDGCGPGMGWTVLAYGDLFSIRDDLALFARAVDGKELREKKILSPGTGTWSKEVERSALGSAAREQIKSSREYRGLFARTVNTRRAPLENALVNSLLQPLFSGEIERKRKQIREIIDDLRVLRGVLCHAQFLRASRFFHHRQFLTSLIERRVIESLVHAAVAVLNRALQTLVRPALRLLDRLAEEEDSPLSENTSRIIALTIGEVCQDVSERYLTLGADIVSQVREKNRQQLGKLQQLGERNMLGSWIGQIDRVIRELEAILSGKRLSTYLDAHRLRELTQKQGKQQDGLETWLATHPLYSAGIYQPFLFGVPIDPTGTPDSGSSIRNNRTVNETAAAASFVPGSGGSV